MEKAFIFAGSLSLFNLSHDFAFCEMLTIQLNNDNIPQV